MAFAILNLYLSSVFVVVQQEDAIISEEGIEATITSPAHVAGLGRRGQKAEEPKQDCEKKASLLPGFR